MPQGMELTRTNRSGGLTTYISVAACVTAGSDAAEAKAWAVGANTDPPRSVLEARREKVQAITLVRQFQDDLFVSDCAM